MFLQHTSIAFRHLLQTLPELVTPLKEHSLSLCICPPTRSAPPKKVWVLRYSDCRSNIAIQHARKPEARSSRVTDRQTDRDRDRETERQRQRDRDRETERQRQRQRERDRDRETERDRERQRDRQTDSLQYKRERERER